MATTFSYRTPTTRRHIDFFFTPPHTDPRVHRGTGNKHSTLYQLRREFQDCYVGETADEAHVFEAGERHRLFASAMVLFAGLDLLAKFHAGEDSIGKSTQRFETFVRKFMPRAYLIKPVALYKARNALVHSFGLYTKEGRAGRRLRVVETCGNKNRVDRAVRRVGKRWELCTIHFFEAFRATVAAFEHHVRSDLQAQKDFMKMFRRYAFLRVN